MKNFDLNIEKVLDHWDTSHALREVIANALDESVLSRTREPEIFKIQDGTWCIKDFGRGLKYQHLTQKENEEKLTNSDKVVGKFGVGLKDALATFDRNRIKIEIRSKHNKITTDKMPKNGFINIVTLHAVVEEGMDPDLVGTEFIFENLEDSDIEIAKNFFLIYSGERVIEHTKYGTVLENKLEKSRIFVNGICISEEDNFLFSYNITSPNKILLKSLNRERNNVGRSAYSDRIKNILLECSSSSFAKILVDDFMKMQLGKAHDELQWLDVQIYASKILNETEKVVFLTSEQSRDNNKFISYAKDEDIKFVTVPDSLFRKMPHLTDLKGDEINTLELYSSRWNDNFEFNFIDVVDLNDEEKTVFSHTKEILSWFPSAKQYIKEVLISETMRPNNSTGGDVTGLWDPRYRRIVIKRSQLGKIQDYAGTLTHEIIHACTNTDDLTLEFENELSKALGKLAVMLLENELFLLQKNSKEI